MQGCVSTLVVVFVQIQACQVDLRGGIFRLCFKCLLELVKGLLQWTEVQANRIGIQAQQGVHCGKANTLVIVIKQWP
ncbi:hypothetical protein D3C78_1902570 [compost metagenome]